ncbi:hypothetical protein ZHAS_00004564 [Anopheles sinensis]|uniref:Uncharacterized protein n=1 Tax=Anopheles sinensis TaxID=74873 RepID=A0A084VH72_ANOSI|nr:hypothetical protein ZHAS_00004564 [Anopheles sinensis]
MPNAASFPPGRVHVIALKWFSLWAGRTAPECKRHDECNPRTGFGRLGMERGRMVAQRESLLNRKADTHKQIPNPPTCHEEAAPFEDLD